MSRVLAMDDDDNARLGMSMLLEGRTSVNFTMHPLHRLP